MPFLEDQPDRRTTSLSRHLPELKPGPGAATPRKFGCSICEDYGLVFVHRKARDPLAYWYFAAARCTCDAPAELNRSYIPTGEPKGSDKRVTGPRRWDRRIPTFRELRVDASEVFSLSARLESERTAFHASRQNA